MVIFLFSMIITPLHTQMIPISTADYTIKSWVHFTFSSENDIVKLIVYLFNRRSLPTAGSFCVLLIGNN